jgi:hypothetical protein
LKNVIDCNSIALKKNETPETTRMKKVLCRIGKKLGFIVDVEEPPESEMGSLSIRHDVLWYIRPPEWYSKLLNIVGSREDLDEDYQDLIWKKKNERLLYVAFEIEATDQTTKGKKGDVSNLSKLPYGVIVVRRGKEKQTEGVEAVRNRFERAFIEFRRLHGPNSVIIASFEDFEKLEETLFP